MKKKLLLLGVIALLLCGMLTVLGCGSGTATTTTAPASTGTTAAPASSTTAAPASSTTMAPVSSETTASTAAAGETKTLKIGYAGWLGFFVGLDTLNGLKVTVKQINDAGGVQIGNDKYMIDLVSYDTNNDQATAVAVANKLISQDKVQFIVWTDFFMDAILPITEQAHVIVCGNDLSGGNLAPANHYSFNTGFGNTGNSVLLGWFHKTYPDKKSAVMAITDDMIGQATIGLFEPAFKAFGFTYGFEKYPASATDLSALGTKIKSLNPDVMLIAGGTFQAYAAARQAGYQGMFFNPATSSVDSMVAQVGDPSVLEGLVSGASPLEFDPALTDFAQAFKQAWIAQNGKWEAPEVSGVAHFDALIAALQKAGVVDVDKVADALASGLEYDTPLGLGRMIARPDLGQARTVDSMVTTYMKKVTGGKAELLETVSLDDCQTIFNQVNPAK
jgi:ABC-type branched-subunit amino acid transport system substrate-binding protein